jgi:hypothetical protein
MDSGWVGHRELEGYCGAVRDTDDVSAFDVQNSQQVSTVAGVSHDRAGLFGWAAPAVPAAVVQDHPIGILECGLTRDRQELVRGEGSLDEQDRLTRTSDVDLEICVTD